MRPAFTKANRYIFDPKALSWSIPSGHTCPGANACLASADRDTGRITNGPRQQFKCYSAELERFPSVRSRYWANFDAVRGKSPEEVAAVLECLPRKAHLVRIHTAGDFFSQAYLDGWLRFVRSRPGTHFYGFTKSLPLWVRRLGEIPPNLVLQASYGGKWDHLISEHGLKFARVVFSTEEAQALGLPIDTDDRLAAYGTQPFALLENRAAMRERMALVQPTLFGLSLPSPQGTMHA
jgi:hypothetical protein